VVKALCLGSSLEGNSAVGNLARSNRAPLILPFVLLLKVSDCGGEGWFGFLCVVGPTRGW